MIKNFKIALGKFKFILHFSKTKGSLTEAV